MDARGRVRKPLSLVVVSVDVCEDRVPRVLLVATVPALFLRPIVLPLDVRAILGDVRRRGGAVMVGSLPTFGIGLPHRAVVHYRDWSPNRYRVG